MERRSLHKYILELGRGYKKALMVMADLIVLPLALWSAFALRLSDFFPFSAMMQAWVLFIATPMLGVVIFARLGLYRAVVRFMGVNVIFAILKGVILLALFMWAAAFILQMEYFPRSVPINFALIALLYVGGSRFFVRQYYYWLTQYWLQKSPVLVYGAGAAGVQLAKTLLSGNKYSPLGFLDDDPALWGSSVFGVSVYNPAEAKKIIEELEINHVLLALPSANKTQRRRILEKLADLKVHVKTIPSVQELVSGESVEALREVEPADLLGRESVPPMESLISSSLNSKVVLITGAGGSIGSELCRQVIYSHPASLILFELSEFALYAIEQELKNICEIEGFHFPIYAVLGSVSDRERVSAVIQRFKVQTIYHAAAYKHVPIVEHNILEGVRNNVFGTKVLAEVSLSEKVERFVLISTDKAVRPTNIMGASKRMAELLLQNMANKQTITCFSMVRFGNVLGSSGSVVPLFSKQIKCGGPVTVTHPEITRYFMTIPEAASLVIQAGSMAKGGDVFVLDMGEPVKILDLAKRMIHLMGHEERSDSNPDGDIEIVYSGLRPGEKLFEELLIGDAVIGTQHPKIMRAEEEQLPEVELHNILDDLTKALANNDCLCALELLKKAVTGYEPSSQIVDWMNKDVEQNKTKALH